MADKPEEGAPAAKPARARKKPALKVVETAPEVVPAEIAQIEEPVAAAAPAVVSRFGKAIEDAKVTAASLTGEARERTAALTETVTATISGTASEVTEKAGEYAEQAKVVALDLARQGKGKATAALGALGETIESNAGMIDEKLGVQYGDYARGAAHTLQSTAATLEAKDIPELGEEVVAFVKKSPVKALGIAAVTGFILSRFLRRKPAAAPDAEESTQA